MHNVYSSEHCLRVTLHMNTDTQNHWDRKSCTVKTFNRNNNAINDLFDKGLCKGVSTIRDTARHQYWHCLFPEECLSCCWSPLPSTIPPKSPSTVVILEQESDSKLFETNRLLGMKLPLLQAHEQSICFLFGGGPDKCASTGFKCSLPPILRLWIQGALHLKEKRGCGSRSFHASYTAGSFLPPPSIKRKAVRLIWSCRNRYGKIKIFYNKDRSPTLFTYIY